MIIPELADLMQEALLVCANKFGVTPESIVGLSRRHDHVIPRHVLMYVFRQQIVDGGLGSLKAVGRFFGNRDHSTVIHATSVIWDAIEKPYAARDLLMASSATDLSAWMQPRVKEILEKAGKSHPALARTLGFVERVEKLEKEIAELRAMIINNNNGTIA